nr:T9SS type A sorting domain-containing protein [uncultured Psychroserpens sp.]
MSNFTRSGRRAKIWQSITNLSCCSIDLKTKQFTSMKAMAFFMLFAFSVSSVIAQQSSRSTFISGCLSDAPSGFSEAEVALLYADECGDLTPEVEKVIVQDGDDCNWTSVITYYIKCGDLDETFKIDYFGGDNSAPVLNDGAEIPVGDQNLNLCFDSIPAGPSAAEIAALFTDNCSDVIVTKSGTPTGSDCEWSVNYQYNITDACGNMASAIDISYSGGDIRAPQLNKGAVVPTGEVGLNLCFSDKAQGPTVEDIAALFTDNCGNVNVEKQSTSKGSDCKWAAQYTYIIQDDCGNFAEPIVIDYRGGDIEAPVLSGVPGDVTVDCIDEVPFPVKGEVFATDNCSSKISIISSDDTSGLDGACLGGVIVRTYSATDDCGRTTSQEQIITVLPTPEAVVEAPVLPSNITCDEAASFLASDVTYSNGVSQGACSVSGSIEAEVDAQFTACGGTITVTYNGVDSCDRPLSAGPFVITVDPAPVAVFDGIEGGDLSCDDAATFVADSLSYTNGASSDACLIAGSVEGEVTNDYTVCGGFLYVDYVFTDDCERTINKKITFTVAPAPVAAFNAVEDMTISCDEAGSFEAGSLSYTNGALNDACLIAGFVEGEATPDYTECGGTITVNYTYTDDCERTIEAVQTITVEPAPMAAFDALEDMTISCDEAGSFEAGSLSYTNGALNEACLIAGSVEGEATPDYTECGGTITVDYTFTDDCQRTITAKQVITVEPAPMATFDALEDMTISCDEAGSFEAGSLSYTNGALNDACLIAGSVEGEATPDYTECGGTITVNYTYTDDCERTIEAVQTITVEPAPMATFDAVEDMTISCDEAGSFEAGSLGYTNGALNDACLIAGSVEGEAIPDYTECGGTITVNYTYTDDCERTIEAVQTITVEPAPMATFDAVEDMTISCDEAGTFEAGSLNYTNGALNEACLIAGSVEGEATPDYTECGGTITVDYTYTDDCERTITAKITVTVEPAPMATFDAVDDMTISCDEAGSFEAGLLGYTNGALNEACLIAGSVEGEATPDYTECGGTITVNYTYTDDCERTIEAVQTITVEPAPMATFDAVEDMTISCDEAGTFEAGSLSYTNGALNDACLIAGSVEGEATPDYTECGGTITVDYTYTDDCQRTITAKQVITVEPAPMATFDALEDMTISCDEAGSFEAGLLGYTNGALNDACLIAGSVEGEATPDYTECGGTITVNYTYTDDCERTIDAVQTITVEPAPMATFDAIENITVTCEEAGLITPGSLTYTNGAADEACLIAGSVTGELSGEYTECGGLLFIDWTYTDDCERTITERVQIKVNPAPMATFDAVEDMTISCDEAGSFEAGSLGYTNGASNEACLIVGSVEGEATPDYTECGGTITVNYTFTDDCERTIEAVQTITVEPAPMATFDDVQNITISCELANQYEVNPLGYSNGALNDACLIEGSVAGELSGDYTECGGTLYVDWTFTDDCERTITVRKTITVSPALMAEFEAVEDMTISCDEAGSFEAGSLNYTNGALNEACLIAGSVEGEATPDYTECGGTITVNYTFTDDCERTIEAVQTITVEPAPIATFDAVEDMTISCDEAGSFEAGSLSYTNGALNDACLIAGSVEGEATPDYTECGGTITVNYTYTDDCERTIEAVQTITVEPAPMATFDAVEDMTISCDEAGSFEAGSLSYTNGALNDACLIAGSVEGEATPDYTECGGTITVDWTFTDDCERTITAKITVTVEPAPIATFDAVEDMTISCDEAGSFEAGSLGYTNGALNDACLIAGSVEGEATPDYTECGGTITVNYTFTDDCERTIEAVQTITVEPAPMATFDAVEDMTISCDEAGTFEAGSLSYTNGALNDACLIAGSVEGEATPDYTECGGTITVDWTFTDDCERTITAKITVTVEPAPIATFDAVEDMTISCDEAGTFEAGSLGYTNGALNDACLIAGSVEGEATPDYTECGGTITVNYTFTDDCERTIEAVQTITVEPAPMATFDAVDDMTISCDEAGSFEAGSLSYTNGALNDACLIAGSVEGEATPDYTECGGTITVDWTFTDDCERTITAKITVTVEPAPIATFDAVEDMTISCDEAGTFEAGSLGYTNGALNDACLIAGSVEGEATPDYTECGGTITVNYTFTDDCERTIEAVQTITVEPAPMAAFDAVEDMTISCDEAGTFEAGSLSYTNGALNDACLIAGSVEGEATPDYTECGGTITVDWTFTDDCERTITAKITVTVEPAPMATFDAVEDMTISCEEANSFEAGSLGYTNGALNDACLIAGSVEGEATPDYTECGGSITVNYTFTDDCERTIEAVQTITVEPAPMAMFDEIEAASIACEDLATYVPEFLSYTNNGTEACEISGSVQGEAEPFDGSCGTFNVNFTFTDDCERTITATQVITVIDETAPVLVGELPQGESNLDLCFENRPEGPSEAEIAALFADNCGNVNVTKTVSAPQEDDCSWAVMYRYEIQDDCGNFANPVKIFYNGGDQSAPELTGTLPEGVTGLQCLSENPGAPSLDALNEAYTDNCGTVVITPLEPVITGDDCGWTATYEYTVVDACDNFADNIVIVNSGADTMAPVLEGELPMGQNSLDLCIDSDLEEPSEEEIAALFTDNCSVVTVTKIEKTFGTDCEWIRVFEYSAKDDCGNMSALVKVNYQGGDNSAPQPTGECDNEVMIIGTEMGAICPADASISLEIGDEISADDNSWSVAGLTIAQMNGTLVPCFTDNCADLSELTYRVTDKGEDRTDCSTTLTVTFEVEDNCENVSQPFVCTFIIVDDTAPIVECPEGEDYGVVTETPSGFADKAPYTDNCQADGQTQDFSDNLSSVIVEGGNYENRLLTSATDFSGNEELIDFDDLSSGEVIANQYISLGVAFSSTDIEEPQALSPSGTPSSPYALNNYDAVEQVGKPVFIDFTETQNRFAFMARTNSSGEDALEITVRCLLNNTVMGTETLVSSGTTFEFFGLESAAGFDRIELIATGPSNNAFSIDNLRFEGGGDTVENHTLVRTFTANDGCDNTASCDVTYTWTTVLTPENDSCEDATPIACGDSVMGSTDYASQESDLPSCDTNLNTSPGVWYVLEGTGDILDVTADTFGSDYDTKLGVFEGSCDALVCVGGNDDTGSLQSEVSFISEVGVDYYVYVSGFGGNTGEYMLTVACEVLSVCDFADELACGDVVTGDTSIDGAQALDGQDCISQPTAIGEWYTFVGTGDTVVFSTCSENTTYDTYLSAYSDCGVTCVANNDDAGCTHSSLHSTIEVETVEGQDYNIFVSGFVSSFTGPRTGAYELSVDCGDDLGTIVDCGGPGETIEVNNYSNNELLEWTFTSSTADPLTLDFSGVTESFYDPIRVYDGLDDSATLLGTFSGDLSGISVTTTQQSVFVRFASDGSVAGFSFDVNVACEAACTDEAPVLDCPEGEDFGLVDDAPTNFVDSVLYTDDDGDGSTSIYTEASSVSEGDFIQTGSEFRFIFEEGYILTFGEGPDFSQGYVTDLSGNTLPSYGTFELVYNEEYFDYDIQRDGENVGFGGILGINPPSCDDSWVFYSEDGHNKAFTLECAQFSATLNYNLSRTFSVEDECGNVSEDCTVEYTWSTIADNTFRASNANFAFTVGSRDQVSTEDVKIDFTAYPVPFDNEVNIAYSFEFDTDVTIELFDTKGLQVFSETNKNYVTGSNSKSTFDLTRYSSQMFYVKLTTSQGSVTKKIVSSGKK